MVFSATEATVAVPLATVVMPQATVVTQLSYRHLLFRSILPTVVSRRIFRGLLYKNEKRYESVVLVQGVPCLRVSLL